MGKEVSTFKYKYEINYISKLYYVEGICVLI